MPQQLKVFQDPSIVQNVPQTDLERLQLALEAKAGRIAGGQESFTPIGGQQTGSAFNGGWGSQGFALPGMNQPTQVATPLSQHISPNATNVMGPSVAQRNALASVPMMATGKDQSRLSAEMPMGPKQQPPLGGPVVGRNIDPLTNAYGPVLQSSPLAAIDAATGGGMAPMPLSRPMSFFAPQQQAAPVNNRVGGIQQQLAARGFNPGPIDGISGPKTNAAIRAFQKANGLVVDGIVGPKTLAALQGKSSVSRSLSSSSASQPKSSNSVAKALSSTSRPASGFGSKGYSEAGKALNNMFRRKK